MKSGIKPILLFCLLAFAPVWAACFVLMRAEGIDQTLLTLIFAGFMFMPALASILTRLICKEGFQNMYLRPRFRGNIGRYALAWFLPILLSAAGAALYLVLRPELFNPVTGVGVPMLAATIAAMLLGPVLNLIPAFGEELGWRGYLTPHLASRMPAWAAGLVSGAIWGLWHAPMIALGHNYGVGYTGYPWTGILLMTLFCICFGMFLTWLTFRTGSAIPAGLAHGGLNAVASVGLLVCPTGYNALIGPFPMGLIGGIPTLLASLIFLALLLKKK